MTHGARSDRLVEPRAAELTRPVFEANPHLDPARNGPAVWRYAVVLARVERVYCWLEEQDDPVFEDSDAGKVHGVYERLERWERAASAAEAELAIAPLTRARLGLDHARGRALLDNLEELAREGRRLDREDYQRRSASKHDERGERCDPDEPE